MTGNEYQKLASRTIPDKHSVYCGPLSHAMLGICSEAGEIADTLKKHLVYGQVLDGNNIEEECGDLLWYIALALSSMGSNMEDIMEANIEKLKIRYPKSFNEECAKERKDKQ